MNKAIISPHVDDDILGCGGIITNNTTILYCGINESDIENRPTIQERLQEVDDVSKYLGYSYEILENKVNKYIVFDLITSIENFINKYKPDEIYIPYPSYNQDHKTVYEASLIALRPHDKNFFVKKVFVYEQPHVFLWDNSHNIGSNFKPNYFKEIDIERKINAYKIMKTQVRSFRSPEFLKVMSIVRGNQANCTYAESFQILRYVE